MVAWGIWVSNLIEGGPVYISIGYVQLGGGRDSMRPDCRACLLLWPVHLRLHARGLAGRLTKRIKGLCNELRVCNELKRIKGLCGAKPPQKPGWTDAVMLGGWLEGPEPWEPGAGERYR
jgi:hypothetical protein